MAIVTTNLLQTIAALGLQALREKIVMARIVNREYEKLITGAQKNGTVNVIIPSAVETTSVTPGHLPVAAGSNTPTAVPITLTEWKEAAFAMDDKAIAQVGAGIIPLQMGEAVKSLANTIDQFLWGKYKSFYGYAGTAGTTPFSTDLSAYLEADKLANDQLMDSDSRFMLIDTAARANALGLPQFTDVSKSGTMEGAVKGQMGEKLGALWLMTQNVPRHVTVAAGTPLLDDAAARAVGVKTLHMDGLTTAPGAGDIFTIAGDEQTYVVMSSTALVGTDTDVTFEPGLKVAIPAVDGNEVVTFKASHRVNLLCHRDAIAFAMAPLEETAMTASRRQNIAVAIDEESGLSLRLEISDQHKQTKWSFDALWGAAVPRPELGVRVAGR